MELKSEQLKKSGFDAALQNVFVVTTEDNPAQHEFMLTELRSRAAPKGYEQFSLLFLGPVEPAMPQGIYCFQHASLGTLPLFMVPVGKSANGMQYEVCISRTTDND